MREKCPNTQFFSCPYFPVFGLNTPYLSVFSPNAGKYGLEKNPNLDSFTQWLLCRSCNLNKNATQNHFEVLHKELLLYTYTKISSFSVISM